LNRSATFIAAQPLFVGNLILVLMTVSLGIITDCSGLMLVSVGVVFMFK
jgi:hypothetical protein